MQTPRFHHHRLTEKEFSAKLRAANLSVRDFMFLTGRHQALVRTYLGEFAANKENQRPSMGDAMILELIMKHPDLVDDMFEIANRYSLGPSAQHQGRIKE